MNAVCEEHSAAIVQVDFTRGVFDKTFWGAEAVTACL